MSNGNVVYPLVIPPGCGYPTIVPARPTKSKFLPWGRRVQPIVSLRGGDAESYFHAREARTARANHQPPDHQDESYPYPRIVSDLIKDDM